MPPRRRAPSANIPVRGHTVQTSNLERASSNLRDIHNRLRSRIEMFQREEDEARSLVHRARLLNERLAEVRRKLHTLHLGDGLPHSVTFHESYSSKVESRNILETLVYDGTIPDVDVPREYVCPITQMMMIDPVMTADGHTYERAAIMEWFSHFEGKSGPTSPLTNLPLASLDLRSNGALRSQIETFIRRHHECQGTAAPTPEHGLGVKNPIKKEVDRPTKTNDTTPIWGSSVVPIQEQNSRELNALRVDQNMVSLPTLASNTQVNRDSAHSLSLTANRARVVATDTTPIWRSSVVPIQEQNSRELNALRVDQNLLIAPPSTTQRTPIPVANARRATSVRPPASVNLNNRHRSHR